MLVYRWYVGLNKHALIELEDVVAKNLREATIYPTRGRYDGRWEASAVVEVFSPFTLPAADVAQTFAREMEQAVVLWTQGVNDVSVQSHEKFSREEVNER